MNRLIMVFVVAGMVICAGCVKTVHRQDLNALPKANGFYGGSILYDTWAYYGSDEQYHYIQYTYNVDNFLHSLSLRIAKAELTLKNVKEQPPSGNKHCALTALLDSSNRVDSFQAILPVEDRARVNELPQLVTFGKTNTNAGEPRPAPDH